MNVREDRHYQDLIISRNIRESTVTEYARDLNAYCNYLNKTLKELIEEAENEEESRIRMKNRKIKRYLLDYYKHLIDQDLRHSTIKKRLTVIKTVYAEYEIDVPKFRIVENDIPETIYSTDLPGHDEIKLILNNCNKKYQAIFCTMATSGMGRGEIQIIIQDISYYLSMVKM